MRVLFSLLVASLLASVGCSNEGTQTTSAASVTNADLQQAVQSKLASDTRLSQISVNVDTARNEVTLSGSVPSEQAHSEAVDLAKSASPNLAVVDQIAVEPDVAPRSEYTEDMARETRGKAKAVGDKIGESLDDAWIYAKIEAKLASSGVKPALQISVDVNKNVVTLRGDVDSSIAKEEAERVAQETEGVKQVHNLLKVKA